MLSKHRKSIKTDRLRAYGITYSMIAAWFGYKDAHSFNGSAAKRDMIRGVDSLIRHVEGFPPESHIQRT